MITAEEEAKLTKIKEEDPGPHQDSGAAAAAVAPRNETWWKRVGGGYHLEEDNGASEPSLPEQEKDGRPSTPFLMER